MDSLPSPQDTHFPQHRHDSHPPRSRKPTDVEARLRDLERQGGSLAGLAHWCAGMLLAAFSLGSLISLSYAALVKFIDQWQHGIFDLPDAISILVSLLLVASMDVAMLFAASMLRTLIAADAPAAEQRSHRLVMLSASLLESGTYLYMLWLFDRPTNLWLWAIGIGRALAAPLFATYLSMARPLPVAPRDIAYYTSLFSGKGVVLDVAELAADPAAPLDRKVRIYSAAARMTATDRERFTGIIAAVQPEPDPPDYPPDPPQNTLRKQEAEWSAYAMQPREAHGPARPVQVAAEARPKNVRTLSIVESSLKRGSSPTQPSARTRIDPAVLRQRRLEAARKTLARYPDVSARDLARAIAIATKHPCSESTAYKLRMELTRPPRPGDVEITGVTDELEVMDVGDDVDETGE